MTMRMLETGDATKWSQVLTRCRHDFYHTAHYHAMAERAGEGDAKLFVFEVGDECIALPLLLRPIRDVPGLAELNETWHDATSVYGYPGPLLSHAQCRPLVVQQFQEALREMLLEAKVVTVFSRLNPLLPQTDVLSGLGDFDQTGLTVSIDLSQPPEDQRKAYRRPYKESINRLRRAGVTCIHDEDYCHLPEFVELYWETMRRVSATESYFYDRQYFADLVAAREARVRLFVAKHEGQVISGGLFFVSNDIVQYHLGGTRNDFLKVSPIKLVFDTVRLWANEQIGLDVLHLGGGVGGREDSLFFFKAGFSDRRHPFHTWRWAVQPLVAERLHQQRLQWNRHMGVVPASETFFPLYRCPTKAA